MVSWRGQDDLTIMLSLGHQNLSTLDLSKATPGFITEHFGAMQAHADLEMNVPLSYQMELQIDLQDAKQCFLCAC